MPHTICRETLDGATGLIATGGDREPTHRCLNCAIPLWLIGEDWIAFCPNCGDEASPIIYCPDCERPDCRAPGHGSNL
jgi:hypothetical protein